MGGLGLVAIGAGVALRLAADKDFYDEAEQNCKPDCSKSTTDSIDRKYNLSIASFAVGGAAIATGGVLWLVHNLYAPESVRAEIFIATLPAGSGVLASWHGTF